MSAVPIATPVTTPSEDPTLAIAELLLVHVPPVVELLNTLVRPTQAVIFPAMAAGNGLTVTSAVSIHPVERT